MKKHPFFLTCGIVCATAAVAAGDGLHGTVTQAGQTRAEVEDIGAIGESDAKGDGKSTAPAPTPSPFRFGVSARANYSSNARLSGDHSSSDFIFFPTLEAGYHQALGHGFAFDALGRIESGIYAVHDERTFIGYSVVNTLEWRPRPNLPRIFIGAEPYRYDGSDGQGRITQAIGTSAGSDWGYSFNNGNSLLFLGYQFTDYFSDPGRDHRLSNTVTVGYTQVLRPQLTMQFYYQYVHDHYPDFSRDDDRHVLALNFTYQLTRQWFTTLSGTFADNGSTQAAASYQSAGVSLSLNYQY